MEQSHTISRFTVVPVAVRWRNCVLLFECPCFVGFNRDSRMDAALRRLAGDARGFEGQRPPETLKLLASTLHVFAST